MIIQTTSPIQVLSSPIWQQPLQKEGVAGACGAESPVHTKPSQNIAPCTRAFQRPCCVDAVLQELSCIFEDYLLKPYQLFCDGNYIRVTLNRISSFSTVVWMFKPVQFHSKIFATKWTPGPVWPHLKKKKNLLHFIQINFDQDQTSSAEQWLL